MDASHRSRKTRVSGNSNARPTTTNTVHFACFDCRKAFKQPGSSSWNAEVPERPFDCPDCKRPMARLGRYFKAPPRRATRQWLKVELLYHFGERFESGHTGLGKWCGTLGGTIRYLVDSGNDASDVRRELERIRDGHRSSGG